MQVGEILYFLFFRIMSAEDNSSDGMTSVSTASLVVDHMPLTISQLTENPQPGEGVMPSDGVLTIAVDTNNSVLQESFSGKPKLNVWSGVFCTEASISVSSLPIGALT